MSSTALRDRLGVPDSVLDDFCERWKITELAVFGSALRDDFGPESDFDFLVSFAPDEEWSLLDHVEMEEELGRILGRPVDIVTRRSVERSRNWIRKKAILEGALIIHAR